MKKPKKKNAEEPLPFNLDDIPVDVLMNYYRHQYERMSKLEDQRTAITNITITLSVLAFTFGFNMGMGFAKIVGLGLLTIMILANVFAIIYIFRTQSWIDTHEMRAKGILERRYKQLHTYDYKTHAEYGRWPFSRWKIQMSLHVLLLIVAGIMIVFLARA